MSHCGKSMNTLEILIFALLHNFNFDALESLMNAESLKIIVSICVVTSQRILARNRIVVAPVDQDILKMEGTIGQPLESV